MNPSDHTTDGIDPRLRHERGVAFQGHAEPLAGVDGFLILPGIALPVLHLEQRSIRVPQRALDPRARLALHRQSGHQLVQAATVPATALARLFSLEDPPGLDDLFIGQLLADVLHVTPPRSWPSTSGTSPGARRSAIRGTCAHTPGR